MFVRGEVGGAFAWEGHGGLLRGTHLVALCMVCGVEVRELEVRRALGLAVWGGQTAPCGRYRYSKLCSEVCASEHHMLGHGSGKGVYRARKGVWEGTLHETSFAQIYVAQNIIAFSAWERGGRTSFSFCYFSFLYIPFFLTTVTDSNTFETSAEHWKLNRY